MLKQFFICGVFRVWTWKTAILFLKKEFSQQQSTLPSFIVFVDFWAEFFFFWQSIRLFFQKNIKIVTAVNNSFEISEDDFWVWPSMSFYLIMPSCIFSQSASHLNKIVQLLFILNKKKSFHVEKMRFSFS